MQRVFPKALCFCLTDTIQLGSLSFIMQKKLVFLFKYIFLKTTIFTACVWAICLNSCKDAEQDMTHEKVFYDVRGFIEMQAAQLNQLKPEVFKITEMGSDKNEITTRNIDWTKELELFAQADINKPSYRQSYTTSRQDSNTYIYISKEGDRLAVRQLTIRVDETDQPVSMEAKVKTENKLYASEKNIMLKCEKVQNQFRITSYRISGFQKLVMMDEKPFLVQSKIKY